MAKKPSLILPTESKLRSAIQFWHERSRPPYANRTRELFLNDEQRIFRVVKLTRNKSVNGFDMSQRITLDKRRQKRVRSEYMYGQVWNTLGVRTQIVWFAALQLGCKGWNVDRGRKVGYCTGALKVSEVCCVSF